MIDLTPLQKLPKNVRDLGKFIVAKGFKKLPKMQKIAQSGHTARHRRFHWILYVHPAAPPSHYKCNFYGFCKLQGN